MRATIVRWVKPGWEFQEGMKITHIIVTLAPNSEGATKIVSVQGVDLEIVRETNGSISIFEHEDVASIVFVAASGAWQNAVVQGSLPLTLAKS